MSRRLLLVLFVLLLSSAVFAYFINITKTPPPAPLPSPPAEVPAAVPSTIALPPAQPPLEAEEDDEEAVPETKTLRAPLKKEKLVKNQQTPDASISLKKGKAREIIPGVTLENKELQIKLEQANESLNLRRENERAEVRWQQKF